MKVLMLGNSFTSANSLPEALGRLLDAKVQAHTRGGAKLAEQLNPNTALGRRTLATLKNETWDYVILQEASTGPITSRENFLRSVKGLCKVIRAAGATPVLFETWPFQRGGNRLASLRISFEEMAAVMHSAYKEAGALTGAAVAEVGQRFFEQADTMLLYASDGAHPSQAGTDLAAQTIADTILAVSRRPHHLTAEERGDSRLRVLLLYQLLLKYTDENHTLSTHQIMDYLSQQYGITVHRTTVPKDIEMLRASGVEIMAERHRALQYYVADRPFSLPELRVLADAVQSSRFLTDSKSRRLTEKLMTMMSLPNSEKLRRSVHVTGKAKTDNEKGYYIVDAITDAIHSRRKISLYYLDYDRQKRPVRKNAGEPYTLSPYDLIWDGDYYYVTGFCDERGEVRIFRVDRIERQPKQLPEAAVSRPKGYRVEHYTQEVFRMFASQETEKVTLLCENEVMRVMIDQFGKAVNTMPVGEQRFRAEVMVCPGPTFYRWVFGWGGKISIEGPEKLREEYRMLLSKEAARYR